MTRWLGLGVLVAGFAVVAIYVVPGDVEPEPPAAAAAEPDAYLDDAAIVEYGADGAPRYRLRARRIAYFEGDETARLTAPRMELREPGAAPWRAQAEFGELLPAHAADQAHGEEQVLFLRGAVRLTQEGGEDGVTEVRTESLAIYPGRRFARSDEPVMIAAHGANAAAAGLQADLRSGRLQLISSMDQRVTVVVAPHRYEYPD